jgi:hypothetical protein
MNKLQTLQDRKPTEADLGTKVYNFLGEEFTLVNFSLEKYGDVQVKQRNGNSFFWDSYMPTGLVWQKPVTISEDEYKELVAYGDNQHKEEQLKELDFELKECGKCMDEMAALKIENKKLEDENMERAARLLRFGLFCSNLQRQLKDLGEAVKEK